MRERLSKGKCIALIISLILVIQTLPLQQVRAYSAEENVFGTGDAEVSVSGVGSEDEETFESEALDPVSSELADVTVMMYCVGSDLEGNSMAATVDITEIMEGIYSSGVKTTDVNFVAETGAMVAAKDGRKRDESIKIRRDQLQEEIKKATDSEKKAKRERYLKRYDYLTKGNGSGWNGIDWEKNQRYEIYADELVPAKTQPSEPSRIMTEADQNKAVPELAEFIKDTRQDYPAKQYMLVFWDHGGGPVGGFGVDERDDDGRAVKSWNIAPTLTEAGIGKSDRFAMVNYDACLMGNLESALSWSPYTRYYCGSEELESNDGDFYENWVSMLYSAAANESNNFSDTGYVDSLMEQLGKKLVDDFYDWYEAKSDIGTKSLVKESEMKALASSLSEYAIACSELFTADPLETYRGILNIRNISQDFHGREAGIVDLSDFVLNINDRFDKVINVDVAASGGMKRAVAEVKKAGNNLVDCEKNAVLHHRETSKYEQFRVGGLTVYLPYMNLGDELTSYLNDYRTVAPAEKLEDYRVFVGTFCAIQTAGKTVFDGNKGQADVEKAFRDALESYGLKESIFSGRMKKLPAEITEHRLQGEGMKISENNNRYYYFRHDYKLVYDVFQSPYLVFKDGNKETEHLLGYLPAGEYKEEDGVWKQELVNYGERKWFAFSDGNGKYIPVAIFKMDSGYADNEKQIPGDPFKAKTDVQIPVLLSGDLCLLDVSFPEGSNNGTINGMWPFKYENRTYGRYQTYDSFKGKEIVLLGDVPNALEGEANASFDHDKPDESDIGAVTLGDKTVLERGVTLCGDENVEKISDKDVVVMDMREYVRDLFGSLYSFEGLRETVKVSLVSDAGTKSRGSSLMAGDIGLEFTGQSGTVYPDSELDKQSYDYCILDESGGSRKLVEKDGKYCTEEPDGGLKEFRFEKDTVICLKDNGISANKLNRLDGANVDLDRYFSLQPATLSVNITVADKPEGGGSSQFTDKSKSYARRALVSDISPVTYTGKKLLTTQSKGNGSRVIDLLLYSEDGNVILQEGVDYKVSYRNNKNAGEQTLGKKAPTLIITGMGDYKGMKYEGVFTIKEAPMSDVALTFNKGYAPLSNKGVSLTATATLKSGVKIPANQLKLHYYGFDGEEISVDDLIREYAVGDELIPLTVTAEASDKAKNIVKGSTTQEYPKNDFIYVYPMCIGRLKVELFANNVSLYDRFSATEYLSTVVKSVKVGKNELNADDLQFLGVYLDKRFTRPVEDDMLTTAGSNYIAVSLTPEKQKEYENYSVVALRVNVTGGSKLRKDVVTMESPETAVWLDELGTTCVPVTMSFDDGFEWDRLTFVCSTRMGGTVEKSINVSALSENRITISDIDNGVPGKYTIQIKGAGRNTGSVKLTYQVFGTQIREVKEGSILRSQI